MPKISYLVSTYDSGSFLDAHLSNLLEHQTDPDFEIVIVNPASPGTDAIIAQKWAMMDSRVNYIYHDVRESYGASWLRAWRAAKSPVVMNSNTDDFHAPETTALVSEAMNNAPASVAFCYGGITVINEKQQLVARGLKPPFDFEVMSRECWAGPQVAWLNTVDFKQSLDWNLMDRRAAENTSALDFWLWLYFMSLGFHAHVIQQFITIYTQRGDSIENRNKWANNYETYAAISEFFPYNFDRHLKHAVEFQDFKHLPHKDDWITTMQQGQKWKN